MISKEIENLANIARALSVEHRSAILKDIREVELHKYLKILFSEMEPNYLIEITHGANELGKDLIIVRTDNLTTDVIGVVVKCGDIRGRSGGDIDNIKEKVSSVFSRKEESIIQEIVSQVTQAQTHSGILRTSLKEVKITKIFIVISGEITNNAQRRITSEIQSPHVVYDLNWLVENFTKYYPQVFFDSEVMDFVLTMIVKFENDSGQVTGDYKLSDYFVDPHVAHPNAMPALDVDGLALVVRKKSLPFSKLNNFLLSKKLILLIGDPGTGKTAALSRIAIDKMREVSGRVSSKAKIEELIDLPVLISALEFLKIGESDDLLLKFCGEELKRKFSVGCLLIDGLDEVPRDDRMRVLSKAESIAQELNCSVVVTSRKVDCINDASPKFERLEILPFEFTQAIKLYEKLLRNNKPMIETLRDGLLKIQHTISIVPLSLVLLAEVIKENREVPASIAELYQRYMDIVLGRYDKEKGIEVLFEHYIKKSFLGSLAYSEFYSKNVMYISQDQFMTFAKGYAEVYGWKEESLGQFVSEIERAGIIRIEGHVEFTHRSFMEFFTAVHIVENMDRISNVSEQVGEMFRDEIWEQAAFFYWGLRRQVPKEFIDIVFHDSSANTFSLERKFAIGRLLQAGWHSPKKVKENGIDRALMIAKELRNEIAGSLPASTGISNDLLADLVLLQLADHSFGSLFLLQELKEQYERIVDKDTQDSVALSLILLWAMYRLLTSDEQASYLTKFLGTLASMRIKRSLDIAFEARILVLMSLLKPDNLDVKKIIDRRFRRVMQLHQTVVHGLLPKPMKPYRNRNRQSGR